MRSTMAEPGETVTLTRKELYDLVWSIPMRTLAPEYGLSDVGFVKLCKRMSVVTPYRGYWTKLQFGHRPKKLRLAKWNESFGKEPTVSMTRRREKSDEELTDVDLLVRAEHEPDRKISISAEAKLHPLVAKTLKALPKSRDPTARVSSEREGCLTLKVAPPLVGRATLILNAIAVAAEARSFSLSGEQNDEGRTGHIVLLGEKVPFSIEQVWSRVPGSAVPLSQIMSYSKSDVPRYEYELSDRLMLRIFRRSTNGRRTKWSDTARKRLEDQLNDFMIGVIDEAASLREDRREQLEWKQRYDAKVAKQVDVAILQREEEFRINAFLKHAKALRKCETLRRYADEVRAEATRRFGGVSEDSEIGKWLRWAEGYVEKHYPLPVGCPLPSFTIDQETIADWREELDDRVRRIGW